MATLTPDDLDDLVAGTLDDLGTDQFQQIAQAYVDYEVMPKWLKKDKVIIEGGLGISRMLMDRTIGAARHKGMGEVDDVDFGDHLQEIRVPWRLAETAWGYFYEEGLMNRGKALRTKVIEPRESAATIDLVEELEAKAWTAPAAANEVDPYGLPYYVVKNATVGFNGGLPSDHTTVAGVNITSHPKYKNYSGTYNAYTKGVLIKTLKTMHRKIRFKSPVNINEYRGTTGENYRNYVNETLYSYVEDIGEGDNQNLGWSLAPMDGQITFKRTPIIWVPYLDNDSQNPWYMINHNTFFPAVMEGNFLRRTGPMRHPLQHNASRVFKDLQYNFVCVDRRRNGVIYYNG